MKRQKEVSGWQNKDRKKGKEGGESDVIQRCERQLEKVRHKPNWKPRQKGPKNWPAYLKMKGAVPSAHPHASANCHGQKAGSGLKHALNKLPGGQRGRWRKRQRGNAEENKGGRGKRWTHKYNDEKWCKRERKSEHKQNPYETILYILY